MAPREWALLSQLVADEFLPAPFTLGTQQSGRAARGSSRVFTSVSEHLACLGQLLRVGRQFRLHRHNLWLARFPEKCLRTEQSLTANGGPL